MLTSKLLVMCICFCHAGYDIFAMKNYFITHSVEGKAPLFLSCLLYSQMDALFEKEEGNNMKLVLNIVISLEDKWI